MKCLDIAETMPRDALKNKRYSNISRRAQADLNFTFVTQTRPNTGLFKLMKK